MRREPLCIHARKAPVVRSAHMGKGSGRPMFRLSRTTRANHPMCQENCGRPSTEVHHIVPWSESVVLRLDPKNLVAVCRDCHERLEALRLAKS